MRRLLAASLVLAAVIAAPADAKADDVIIKRPGAHPRYGLELEPHLLLGVSGRFRERDRNDGAVGLGVRGTLILVDNGFVSTINNSVGLGVGLDFVPHNSGTVLLIPVVMQWNFFLSKNWSVFGEPGAAVYSGTGRDGLVLDPILEAGGRFHFSDSVTLTMRAGWPALSVGVSFLF